MVRSLFSKFNGYLPWGILIANTVGTAIAALATFYGGNVELILAAGVAGGLSTFSTFVAQTWQMMIEERRLAAFFNVTLNLVLPFTTFALVLVCQ